MQIAYKNSPYTIFYTLVTLLLVSASWVLAADQKPTPAPAEQQVQVVAPKTSSRQQISLAASKSGVVTCLPRINQVVNFISGEAPTGAMLFVAPDNINKNQTSLSLELDNPNSSLSTYVSANFSPSVDGGCSGSYEAITFWLNPCDELAKNVFTTFKPTGRKLKNQIAVLEEGQYARVFLMPAVGGCIAIKKEVLY